MADKKVTELNAISSATGDDVLLIVNDPGGTPVSNKITVRRVFADVGVPVNAQANLVANGSIATLNANTTCVGQFVVNGAAATPGSNNTTTEQKLVGSMWWDEDYLYLAANTTCIRRVALSVWNS